MPSTLAAWARLAVAIVLAVGLLFDVLSVGAVSQILGPDLEPLFRPMF